MAGNAGLLRGAVGLLGVVVLLWGNDLSETRLVWSLVLVLVLLAVVQVLVGAGNASRDQGSRTPSGETRNTRDTRAEVGAASTADVPSRGRTGGADDS